MSVKKEFVYNYELPVKLAELAKEGYIHFAIDLLDPTKTRIARVQLKAWKNVKPRMGFECDCGARALDEASLQRHQEARKHGPYAKAILPVPGPAA